MKDLIKKILKESTPNRNYIFVRTDKFDNTGTIRKFPYKGISCWCIYEDDYEKYVNELELWGGNEKDVRVVNPGDKEIFVIDYPLIHKYVMGESDVIPEPKPFDPNKHIMKFIKQPHKSMLEYISDMKYQILLI